MAEIRAKDPLMGRSAEEVEYLWTHDPGLAAIREKMRAGGNLCADDIDYEQKALGFINTMACLSPQEKRMYDELVAAGNTEAAGAVSMIGFLRATSGHVAGGADGTTYDPIATAITADNVIRYFMHSFVDSSGASDRQFQALASYLENRPAREGSA